MYDAIKAKKDRIEIKEELCSGCGSCVSACYSEALEMKKK